MAAGTDGGSDLLRDRRHLRAQSVRGHRRTIPDCAKVPWKDTIVSPNPYRQTRGGSAADYPNQMTTYTRASTCDPGAEHRSP